jgi:hypothetical protein
MHSVITVKICYVDIYIFYLAFVESETIVFCILMASSVTNVRVHFLVLSLHIRQV